MISTKVRVFNFFIIDFARVSGAAGREYVHVRSREVDRYSARVRDIVRREGETTCLLEFYY